MTGTGSSHARSDSSSKLTRSRSLDSRRGHTALRSRSVDCAADRSSPETEDHEATSGSRYVVLADYMALTSREIDLNEVIKS